MVVNKPAVLLYCHEPDVDYLKEICAGIEEEGVLFQILNREDDMDSLAYQAAKDSMLGVGIGIDGRRIAMQMNRVPKGKNIFEMEECQVAQKVMTRGERSVLYETHKYSPFRIRP